MLAINDAFEKFHVCLVMQPRSGINEPASQCRMTNVDDTMIFVLHLSYS